MRGAKNVDGHVPQVLMIAFHFPPLTGSSGLLRTVKFSQFLLEFGWRPIVLTAKEQCYPTVQKEHNLSIPDSVQIFRAWGLDAQRHLAIGGRYFKWLALPDRWITWWFGAMRCGLRLIKRQRPQVIWSTYPIATAHLIGIALSKFSHIPLVADFRDPMTEEQYPEDTLTRTIYRWIEKQTIQHCRVAVFTTPSALSDYFKRYPSATVEKFKLIANGYDEADFPSDVLSGENGNGIYQNQKIRLVHSGLLYPHERDPITFFKALSELHEIGVISKTNLQIVFRACGHDTYFSTLICEMGLEWLVEFLPRISYKEALKEMVASDGLLIFQASNCNSQIPAKTYEYLRAQRPILGIIDPLGDTAGVLKEVGSAYIADINDKEQIKDTLLQFVTDLRSGSVTVPQLSHIQQYSRKSQAKQLAEIFNSLI